jgi:AraC-like DNA-binding protein
MSPVRFEESAEPGLRQQSELARLIGRFTCDDGMHSTDLPGLWLNRSSTAAVPNHGISIPALCLIAQGSKQVLVGSETYRYDPAHYLLISVGVPCISQVIEATPERPYLGLTLSLDPALISDLMLQTADSPQRRPVSERGLAVSRMDGPLQDAVLRLTRLLATPERIPVLAPLTIREILYLLLLGDQGARLCQLALDNSATRRVASAIDWIKRHYAEPLTIEELAREVHMSASGLHHHFKAVTALSPLQYQKQLRLQEARRLMLAEALDATEASYEVGYESPSQFNREYSRLFGEPPLRDIARLRNAASHSSGNSA